MSVLSRLSKGFLLFGLAIAPFLLAACMATQVTHDDTSGNASPPLALVAVPGDAKITVAWRRAEYDTTVTQYEAAATPDTAGLHATLTATTKSCTAGKTDSLCTITGLTNGVAYHVGVRAYNTKAGDWRQAFPVTPTSLPNAPARVAAYPADGFAQVAWSASWVAQGDGAITGYAVTTVQDSGKTCATGGDSTCDVTGLTNGTAYTFTVKAVRSGTSGASSAPSAAVTPGVNTVPSPPRNLTLLNAGYGPTAGTGPQIVVRWKAPRLLGGSAILSYTVIATPEDTTVAPVTLTLPDDSTLATDSAGFRWTPLIVNRNGGYTIAVKATNAMGLGAAAPVYFKVTGTPIAPFAPPRVTAVTDTNRATVSWTVPFGGGSFVTGYVVSVDGVPDRGCTSMGPLSCNVNGLDNNRSYTFIVQAINSVGTGPGTASAAAAMPTLYPPGAPTNVTATAVGINLVTVSWTPPLSNGGSRITGYVAYAVEDTNRSCTAIGSGNFPGSVTCDIIALTAGIPFTFKVKAINDVGTGPASAASAPATPIGLVSPPGKPTGLRASPNPNGSVYLDWTQPVSNGGAFITSYVVTDISDTTKSCTAQAYSPFCTISGLPMPSNYAFVVRAFNSAGGSQPSVAALTYLSTYPSAPSDVIAYQAQIGDGHGPDRATVAWDDGNNGGQPIINSYAEVVGDPSLMCGSKEGQCTIIGLVTGQTYTFHVRSANVNGESDYSAPSAPLLIQPAD